MKMFMHWWVCLGIFFIWRRLWQEDGWLPVNGLKVRFPFVSHVFAITPSWAAFFLALVFAVHPAGSHASIIFRRRLRSSAPCFTSGPIAPTSVTATVPKTDWLISGGLGFRSFCISFQSLPRKKGSRCLPWS